MIKGILFDKDGTLLEYEAFWLPVATGAIQALLESHGIDPSLDACALSSIGARDGIRGVLCHGTYGDIAEAMNRGLGVDFFTSTEVAAAFADNLHRGALLPTCPNLASVLDRLHGMGIRLALVTSDNETVTGVCLRALGIEDRFDCIFADDGVHPSKPDPYYLNAFCHAFGISPRETAMVGDTLTDMRFARAGGALAIGVAKAPEDAAILAPSADAVVADVSCIFDVIGEE